ncbi:hypothetical protein HPB52_021290 [Rhipicephalus sanguineus]|uniref:Uncharacterized protein n=1 Tax=Rhipicephalus sanguineus TaxID=34632 RepID=A0A9D4T1T6_RHISA|nr:hypothetical protein HPB52_021290 [Rhipicephalus sanguineus]
MALSTLKGRNSKFNADLLKDVDANGDLFEAWCRAGEREFCVVCSQTINCAFHGVIAVKRHSQSKKHSERTKQLRGPDGKLKRPAAVQAVLNFSAATTIASYTWLARDVTIAAVLLRRPYW